MIMRNEYMCKVSIIIPVYNTGEYLIKCLDSCMNQTLKDLEVIVIDDASTDDYTIDIMNKYKKRYDNTVRLKRLEKNRGQGIARNVGISLAHGKYLYFLDSDDFLETNACNVMYDMAQRTKADIVFCDSYFGSQDKRSFYSNFYFYGEIRNKLLLMMDVSPCGKIISSDIIKGRQLYFPNEKYIYEDSAITPVWTLEANKYAKVDLPLWTYVRREGSIIHIADNQFRELDLIKAIDFFVKKCKELKIYSCNRMYIEIYILARLLDTYYRLVNKYDIVLKEGISKIKDAILQFVPNYKANELYDSFFMVEETNIIEDIASGKMFADNQSEILAQELKDRYNNSLFEQYCAKHEEKIAEFMQIIKKHKLYDYAIWGANIQQQIIFSYILKNNGFIKIIDPGKRMQQVKLAGGNRVEDPQELGRDYQVLFVTNNSIHKRIREMFPNATIINMVEIIRYKMNFDEILCNLGL